MVEYRRNFKLGGCYFFTQVTYERRAWLCAQWVRRALRDAIEKIREESPLVIDAWVLLPEHLHCIWRLPEGDADYSLAAHQDFFDQTSGCFLDVASEE